MNYYKKFLVVLSMTLFVDIAMAEPPRFASDGVLLPGSQFRYDSGFDIFDWDDDGRADLVLANNAITRFQSYRVDGDPDHPVLGHGYNYPYNFTETMPQTIEHAQGYTWCELNGDGLRDLIVFDGQLRMVFNTGDKTAPNHWHLAKSPQFFPGSEKMIQENMRYVTGPESMYWNRGIFPRLVLTMAAADWDGDGLQDLLICRFRDEAPGVVGKIGNEVWPSRGRHVNYLGGLKTVPPKTPEFLQPLAKAPARETWFYKNTGTPDKPYFDEGVQLQTTDGKPVVAPSLQAVDIDGDGVLDLLSTETAHACNSFRVDWPTAATVQWHRRPDAKNPALVEPAQPLSTAKGKPIAAGISARMADFRGNGQLDLFVQDAGGQGTIRWYRNSASDGKAAKFVDDEILHGDDFCRFNGMQPLVVDWFGPGSRDLILHGGTDVHCKWSLRRTGLYRNVAKQPGEVAYQFVGWLTFNGDPAMVSPKLEDRPYDCYGTMMCLAPDLGDGKKRLVMSVSGKSYWFSDLADDGLTFRKCQPLDLPAERNRRKGWQDIPVSGGEAVRYIRINNDRNGMHGFRDHYLNVEKFEAFAAGKNVATIEAGATVGSDEPPKEPGYHVNRPEVMISSEPTKERLPFTSFGYALGPAVVTLKEPVQLEKIRFLLSDKDSYWFNEFVPYYWQGELFRAATESRDIYYQYTVEVSADKQKWTKIADTMWVEMARSTPYLHDWNGDGKLDLFLCAMHTKGIYPQRKDFRLYLNKGSNDSPLYNEHLPLCDAEGKPLDMEIEWALLYSQQCSMVIRDFDDDGKVDLLMEGVKDGSVEFWRNVSKDVQDPRFEFVKKLGDPSPIKQLADSRSFAIVDVDGDKVLDWLESRGEMIAWYKGTAADAPATVTDLALVGTDKKGVTVSWNPPENATRYEIAWSPQSLTEAKWAGATRLSGEYPSSGTSSEAFQKALSNLPQGTSLFVRIKSFNAAGADSPLSNELQVATTPNRQIVLRNGPKGGADTPAYEGCVITYLHSQSPEKPADHKGNTVEVNAPGRDGHRVVLVRFQDLPQVKNLKQATLELTLPPTDTVYHPPTCDVSCLNFRPDWIAAEASYQFAAANMPWEAEALTGGERVLSRAPFDPILARKPELRWDVSDAVRRAQEKSERTIDLLIRVDDTGHYVSGRGYTFCDASHPDVKLRPRLRVIATEN